MRRSIARKAIALRWWCAVFVVVFGTHCGALMADAPPDEAVDEMRAGDEHGDPASRVTSRATTDSNREPIESPPIYEEVAPDGTEWYEPIDDLGEDYGNYCENCGGSHPCGCMAGGFWGSAEALYWWIRGSHVPPLVTSSPDGTSMSTAGILPGAEIPYGNQTIARQGRPGGRFTVGYWLYPYGFGIEDTFWFLGNAAAPYYASSTGSPILARPFFNTQTGLEDAFLVAFPNVVSGSIRVGTNSTAYNNELSLRRALYVDGRLRFDFLFGYRLLHFSEGLRVHTNTTALQGGSSPAGTIYDIRDSFNTRNQFNGGQIGFKIRQFNGPWTFDVIGKLAVGAVSQRVQINGSTVITEPNTQPATYSGGILALPSNIGTYKRTRVGYLPEVDLNLAYQLTPAWKVNFGYTLMYLNDVARPGDQISLQLDPSQFPPGQTGSFPAFKFTDSNIWIQGINLGAERSF